MKYLKSVLTWLLTERPKGWRKKVRRVRLAMYLYRQGVRRPLLVLKEADRASIPRWAALTILDKETGIPQRNVFGCDHGPGRAFCHEKVTSRKVKALLDSPYSNGVGWTQLTYKPYVRQAQRLGGAHKPKYQMRVGFKKLHDDYVATGSWWGAFKAYNGAAEYANDAEVVGAGWRERIRSRRG